jgi:murein DD-endopeptidase MepM/ murein hydrolase activator NlpD
VIDHGNGYKTLYGHLSAFNADYGERVGKGDRIGSVGSTGLSTGPHLHFEVMQNGVRVNPLKFLP